MTVLAVVDFCSWHQYVDFDCKQLFISAWHLQTSYKR